MKSISLAAIVVVSLARSDAAQSLLSPADRVQLTTWLGEGPKQLTLLFEKQPGNTAADFHAACDGQGRTFVVAEVLSMGGLAAPSPIRVGGFNPQSWSSSDGFHITGPAASRTGFLFNLETGIRRRQDPTLTGGQWQTYNSGTHGPTFGGGHDLYFYNTLDSGYSFAYSYGLELDGVTSGYSGNIAGLPVTGGTSYTYGRLEVFRIDDDTTPPTLSCPASIAIRDRLSNGLGEVVSFVATAIDDLDPSPGVVCIPASGSLFMPGTTMVLCTATDAAGNQVSCQFPITVEPKARRR